MFAGDAFSQWLGIQVEGVGPGSCTLRMTVREEMLNGFRIAHGGVTYALSDSCLAFASNSHGIKAVSVETSISHTRKVKAGEVLLAVAEEKSRSRSIGIYHVTVTDASGTVVALFKGTVHHLQEPWFPEDHQL